MGYGQAWYKSIDITGNTCRSQMAHGFMASYGDDVAVYSGGVSAEKRVNPRAVMVMREMGIDISDHTPHQVDEYLNEDLGLRDHGMICIYLWLYSIKMGGVKPWTIQRTQKI